MTTYNQNPADPLNNNRALCVLIQNRPNAFTQRGGDTVLMEQTAKGLQKLGVTVDIDLHGTADLSKYDIVHLFNFALPQLIRAYADRAAQSRKPFVVTSLYEDVALFHNQSHALTRALCDYISRNQDASVWEHSRDVWSSAPRARGFDNAWVAQNAAAILISGKAEGRAIARDFHSHAPFFSVACGFEVGASGSAEEFVRAYGVKDFVLCVGRLESRKNQLMLLKALEDSELPVVLAGGGFTYQPEYDQAVRNFKRRGQTLVLGNLSPQMLASAYQAARIHALPSWYELPGIVSLEAAYYGKNIVVTDNGTARDYFGNSAFYCRPEDEVTIQNAVVAAYYSPFKSAAREVVLKTTWDQTAQQTLAAYKSVLNISDVVAPNVATAAVAAVNAAKIAATIEAGEGLVDNGNLSGALDKFSEAMVMDPGAPRALRAKGAILLSQGNHKAARDLFQRSLQREPNHAKALSGIGMCALAAGDVEEAYKMFVNALSVDAYQLVAIRQLLECSYRLNRYTDLEQVLRTYVATNSSDIEMRFCLAGCLYKQGSFSEAKTITHAILATQPGHRGAVELKTLLETTPQMTVHQQVAPVMASDAGKPSPLDAKLNVSNAIEVETLILELEDEKWRHNFGEVRRRCGEILSRPGVAESHQEKLRILQAEVTTLDGSLDEAVRLYDEILAKNPNSARALCGKGSIAAHNSKWMEAKSFFARAREINPREDIAWAGLGVCALQEGAREAAWDNFIAATKLNSENSRALLGLIELGYQMQRLPHVEQALRAYLDAHPIDIPFMYSLAGCCFAQNKLQEAQRELEKITIFEPEHKDALELKAMIASRAMSGQSARV